MELVVAPIAELRMQLAHLFEELVGATLDRGTGAANVSHSFSCGLTGGSTALIFLGALRDADVNWQRVTLFWGDERAVEPDHPDSNYGLAERLLLLPLGGRAPHAIRMAAESRDVHAAADAYQALLVAHLSPLALAASATPREAASALSHATTSNGALDLIILGVGDDGHVCALFPGHPALMVDDRWVMGITDSPKPPPARVTLTLPFLLRARHVWIVAVGARKLPLLERALARDTPATTPLDLVIRGASHVTVFTDQVIRANSPGARSLRAKRQG